MKTRSTAAFVAIALVSLALSPPVSAQDEFGADPYAASRPVLSRSASGSELDSFPSPMELRQARAWYQAQQRVERMERNAWLGHEPLRPHLSSVPMMSSRYPSRRVVYLPLYLAPQW